MARESRLMAHTSRLVAQGSSAPNFSGHEPRALSHEPWGMSHEHWASRPAKPKPSFGKKSWTIDQLQKDLHIYIYMFLSILFWRVMGVIFQMLKSFAVGWQMLAGAMRFRPPCILPPAKPKPPFRKKSWTINSRWSYICSYRFCSGGSWATRPKSWVANDCRSHAVPAAMHPPTSEAKCLISNHFLNH